MAKRTETARSDIDLMVISDTLTYPDVFRSIQPVERILARPVNPTVLTRAEWRTKRAQTTSFAARVGKGPRLFVIGSDDDLAKYEGTLDVDERLLKDLRDAAHRLLGAVRGSRPRQGSEVKSLGYRRVPARAVRH